MKVWAGLLVAALGTSLGTGLGWAQGGQTASGPAPAAGQTAAPAAEKPMIVTTGEAFNMDKLAEQGRVLVEQARKGSGSAGTPLSKYRNSFTSLAVRTVDGGGEVHKKLSDFLFVIDGEGTELVGGTMVDPKEGANGEVRGTRIDGATPHALKKGDMIHVPAGVPHQQLVAKGKSLVVYVIKVEETN